VQLILAESTSDPPVGTFELRVDAVDDRSK